MQALVKKLKLLQVGDTAVRRNPLFYADAQRELERLEEVGLAERRDWTLNRLSEILFPASRTGYGKIVRGGGDIASWPLLTKGEVRAAPAHVAPEAPGRGLARGGGRGRARGRSRNDRGRVPIGTRPRGCFVSARGSQRLWQGSQYTSVDSYPSQRLGGQ